MTADRPWVTHYAPETSKDIPPLTWPNLAAMVRESAAKYHELEAFTLILPNGTRGRLTFAEVDELSDAFAVYLREVAGFKAGDRLALQMPNCLAYPVAVFGALKAGLVMVNTNPLYTATEMAHQFADSGATGLVLIDLFADRAVEALPKTKITTVVIVNIADLLSPLTRFVVRSVQKYVKKQIPAIPFAHTGFLAAIAAGRARIRSGADARLYAAALGQDDIAALQYTGGTTGVSKGAVLTHGNLLSNVVQSLEMWKVRAVEREEVMLTALPLYHIFAFTANLMIFFTLGGRNILIPSPRPLTNLQGVMTSERITWFTGVNTLFAGLMNEAWFQAKQDWAFKGALAGGMALVPAVGERWVAMTRTPIYQGYGLTETSPVVTLNPFHRDKLASIGVPAPGTDMRIVDPEGHDVPPGEAGEILVKGPQVMPGYWQRPDESARVLKDGWLSTGDIGTMDEEGYFFIVDRKKDMILVSGFNVYPNEVEAVLAEHPGVGDVAVVGAPDETTGEVVCAYVVRKDASVTAEVLQAHCRKSLTNYKIPKHVHFRDELPKSPVGKVLRKDLRDDALRHR